MTTEFVRSQVEYYGRNLGCGPYHSQNLIHGLYTYYKQLLDKRVKDELARTMDEGL